MSKKKMQNEPVVAEPEIPELEAPVGAAEPAPACDCESQPCECETALPRVSAEEAIERILAPVDSPPVSASALVSPDPKPMLHWAELKGHLPNLPNAVRFPGQAVHSKPHLAVVLVHSKLASNSLVTEAEYDRLAEEAYGLRIG